MMNIDMDWRSGRVDDMMRYRFWGRSGIWL